MHATFSLCARAKCVKVRGTSIGPTKKVRDVFSACLRIDVPHSAQTAAVDGHVKLVMCFVEVSDIRIFAPLFATR